MTDTFYKHAGFYKNRRILAPMVRCGTLPMRIMALAAGADLVYTPECIALALSKARRCCNPILENVVDYVTGRHDWELIHDENVQNQHHRPSLILRMKPILEAERVVLQLGAAYPEEALAAAQVVGDDCAAVDLNCGCPKRFSLQGGMGAALLSDPDRLCSILSILLNNLNKPVSCKIRLLSTDYESIELVKRIVQTGVHAIAIHARTPKDRYTTPANYGRVKNVISAVVNWAVTEQRRLPTWIINGDVVSWEDAYSAMQLTGTVSYMIARGALMNVCDAFRVPSVESWTSGVELPLPKEDLPILNRKMISDFDDESKIFVALASFYVRQSLLYDTGMANCKFTLLSMIGTRQEIAGKWRKAISQCRTMRSLCAVFNLEVEYDQFNNQRFLAVHSGILDNYVGIRLIVTPSDPSKSRVDDLVEEDVPYEPDAALETLKAARLNA